MSRNQKKTTPTSTIRRARLSGGTAGDEVPLPVSDRGRLHSEYLDRLSNMLHP